MAVSAALGIVVPWRPNVVLRALGVRFKDGARSWRTTWGEIAVKWGLGLELMLFSEHYSLKVHLLAVACYVNLPWLQRWHYEPFEMMESWGFGTFDGALHLHWGRHTTIWTFPWRNWTLIAHEVMRPDGTWVPFVGSWETGKEPDGRVVILAPYRYVLERGEVQNVDASVHVERWTRSLTMFRALRCAHRAEHSIAVSFSSEVGERSGSWKGGTVGCSYALREDETPLECLRRMQKERRFQ